MTATDKDGADTAIQNITLTVGGSLVILSSSGSKKKGRHVINLSWSGAATGSMNIYRDGNLVGTTSGSSYTNNTGEKGGTSYVSKVCEANNGPCSNEITTAF